MIKEKTTLELIYEKYRNRMYMAAYRIVKNPTVAEDVLHDTFVALSKNTEKLSPNKFESTKNGLRNRSPPTIFL